MPFDRSGFSRAGLCQLRARRHAAGHTRSNELKQAVLNAAGGPIRRFIASRWLRNKDSVAVAKFIHSHRPKDVINQWEKIHNAQGLAFIAPVFWLHFPAILKGGSSGSSHTAMLTP